MTGGGQHYRGAWFTVEFPDGFTIVPGLSSTTGDGHDSVRFRDATGGVEFYVFSLQAGGTAADLANDLSNDELVSRREKASDTRTVCWSTFRAKDGSYQRSVEEMRTADGLQDRVFAITYRTAADLQASRSAYLTFKQSLKQFQD